MTRPVPDDFRVFLHRHRELLTALREWSIRILVPLRCPPAARLYQQAVREEFMMPLRTRDVEELEDLFCERRRSATPFASPPLDASTAVKAPHDG